MPYPQPGYRPPPPGYRPLPVAPNGAPLADFGQRLAAYLLDALVVAAVALVPIIIGLAVVIPMMVDQLQPTPTGTVHVGGLILLELVFFAVLLPIQLLIQYLYMVVYQVRKGQTVGKRVMKIKIVRLADGAPMDMEAANKRFLVQIGCGFLGPVAYLDGFWQLWDQPYRQCLHDKWPRTVVVRVPA